jgi:nitrogen fixation NifU-like protein
MSFDDIYSDFIMHHYRNSTHRGIDKECDLLEKGANLSCGDEITLFVRMKEGKISSIAFEGHGCAISKASASVMADLLEGKTLEEARETLANFSKMLRGESFDENLLGDAVLFERLREYPMRVKCASLAWKTAERALQ